MRKRAISYNEGLYERLQDLEYAREYLNACIQDSGFKTFLVGLRNVANAGIGLKTVAEKADLNREYLYRTLSDEGNPRLDNLSKILDSLGLRLAVERAEAPGDHQVA